MPESDRIKWDRKYADSGRPQAPPSAFVQSVLSELPTQGRCLDVAGGAGRNALPLAAHGLDVTVCDVSPARPRLGPRGRRPPRDCSLETLVRDVEEAGLPAGPWDVVVCVHFLHRSLFDAWARALAPGGWLLFEHPTRANLERHARPSERYLLEDGELPSLLRGLDVVRIEEGWGAEGRHEARLLARRPR